MRQHNKCGQMQIAYVAFLVSLILNSAQAQPNGNLLWSRTYGGTSNERAYDLDITQNGELLLSGFTRTFGIQNNDVYLVRTDLGGDTIWTQHCGLYWQTDKAYGAVEDRDGNIFTAGLGIAGHTPNYYYSAQVNKLDSNGTWQWYHDYGGLYDDDIAYDICLAKNDPFAGPRGYVVAGTTYSSDIAGSDWPDAFLIRINVSGNGVWIQHYHRASWADVSAFGSVDPTFDGGYICAGFTSDEFSSDLEQGFIVKTDSVGNEQWQHTWGLPGHCCSFFNAGKQSPDSSYWFVGTTLDGEDYDGAVQHRAPNGDYIGTYTIGWERDESFFDLDFCPDGSCVVVGYTTLIDETYDIYLVKFAPSGEVVWESTYGGPQSEDGYSVKRLPDGTYAIAGWTNSYGAGLEDMWLICVDPDDVVPAEDELNQTNVHITLEAYPNPFNSATTVTFSLGKPTEMQLKAYDIQGRLARTLIDGFNEGTPTQVQLHGANWPSGSYFLRLETPDEILLKRVVLVK